MEEHIVKKQFINMGFIKISTDLGTGWSEFIPNVGRPFTALIVDNKYQLPDNVEVLHERLRYPAVSVNEYDFGRIMADNVVCYLSRSPRLLIFQIEVDDFSINDNVFLY